MIDDVRRYWDQRPCNIRHSGLPLGSAEYFDAVEARKYFVEPHIPEFAQFCRWKGKHVLELGCGIGTDTINFARAGAIVTAVDVSAKSLQLLYRRAYTFELDRQINLVLADMENLGERIPQPSQFDLIYSFGAIHHTPHPEHVIAQLRRFCHPQTELKIMLYHRHSIKALELWLKHGSSWLEHTEAEPGCPVSDAYSRSEGRALLETWGFEIIEARVAHIFPFEPLDYARGLYTVRPLYRLLTPGLFHRLERVCGWHLLVTAKYSQPHRQTFS